MLPTLSPPLRQAETNTQAFLCWKKSPRMEYPAHILILKLGVMCSPSSTFLTAEQVPFSATTEMSQDKTRRPSPPRFSSAWKANSSERTSHSAERTARDGAEGCLGLLRLEWTQRTGRVPRERRFQANYQEVERIPKTSNMNRKSFCPLKRPTEG